MKPELKVGDLVFVNCGVCCAVKNPPTDTFCMGVERARHLARIGGTEENSNGWGIRHGECALVTKDTTSFRLGESNGGYLNNCPAMALTKIAEKPQTVQLTFDWAKGEGR